MYSPWGFGYATIFLVVLPRMHNRVVRLNKNTQLCVNPRDQKKKKNVHHYHVKE